MKRFIGCALSMDWIQVPIDGVAEIKVFVAQQVETTSTNLVRLFLNLYDLLWKPLFQRVESQPNGVRAEEKSAFPGNSTKGGIVREIKTKMIADCVGAFGELLLAALQQFAAIHCSHSCCDLPPTLMRHRAP